VVESSVLTDGGCRFPFGSLKPPHSIAEAPKCALLTRGQRARQLMLSTQDGKRLEILPETEF